MHAFERSTRLEAQLAHADQILRHLGEPLLALVLDYLRPVLELLVDLSQCLNIIL